jgi:outer membrane receptor protein involved in Fe transport
VRYDRVRSTNTAGYFGDLSVTHAEPSGYLGVTFGPFSGFSSTVQYSRGFRDARLSDRFFRGVTGAGVHHGQPRPQPETSDQYDLVLRWGASAGIPGSTPTTTGSMTSSSATRIRLSRDSFFFRNRGTAEIRGIELEIVADLPAKVQLLVAGSLSQGEALDDGTPLDDIAPENAVLQARKELGSRAWVQLRGAWLDALDEPGPNEVAMDSRTWWTSPGAGACSPSWSCSSWSGTSSTRPTC